jgi:hypothetical protein
MTESDMSETLRHWEQEIKDRKTLAVKFVLMAMKLHNVKCVVCEYSGSGDSGCVEETHILEKPVEPDDFHCADVGVDETGKTALETSPLRELLNTFEDTLFESHFGNAPTTLLEAINWAAEYMTPSGFEINDGGQGVIVFDAVNNECRCEHGSNIVEVNYETETIEFEEGENAASSD